MKDSLAVWDEAFKAQIKHAAPENYDAIWNID